MSLINNRLDHFQEGSFAWFTGVVEDVLDPQELGRVRVRCFGYHTEKREEIPTNTLPWALVMTPITNPCMDSIGESATGIIVGTWVVGFFRDGKSAQDPVVLGTLPSKTSNIDPSRGFSDPFGDYPKRINSPDMPLEARSGFRKAGTYSNRIDSRQDAIETAIAPNVSTVDPSSGDEERKTWNSYRQEDVHKTQYPFNKVNKTINGHLIEIDDTPGYKRLLTQHASGTYQEIVNDGSRSTVVKGTNYTVIFQNDNVYVKGSCNLTVDGDVRTLVKGNYHLEVRGDYTENIEGNKKTKIGGNEYVEVDYHYNRNIGRSHNDRVGTNSTIIVDKNKNLVVSGTYDEFISGTHSSICDAGREIAIYGNSEEFVLGNKDITVMANSTFEAAGNYQQSSVGATTIGSTGFLNIGSGNVMSISAGSAIIENVVAGPKISTSLSDTTISGTINKIGPTNVIGATSIIGATSVVGATSILGTTNITGFATVNGGTLLNGAVTSTGVVMGANFIAGAATLATHKHVAPSSGGVTSPPFG